MMGTMWIPIGSPLRHYPLTRMVSYLNGIDISVDYTYALRRYINDKTNVSLKGLLGE